MNESLDQFHSSQKQPEALRLANEFDNGEWIAATGQWREEAATELRRLHAVNQELLEALLLMVRTHDEPAESLLQEMKEQAWLSQARAAIAKSTGGAV